MNNLTVNLENLTEKEREQLLKLVSKSNKGTKLSDIENGKTFKIGDIEFIKFKDINGATVAVAKDIVFKSKFGDNNNLHNSAVHKKLVNEFLSRIADEIGMDNILEFETDLTTLDGLKPYKPLRSRISLPTLDFYRENVDIFDEYKIDDWWWLATAESTEPHEEPKWLTCVSPRGGIYYCNHCGSNIGVRPLLHFVSSIFVSCDE